MTTWAGRSTSPSSSKHNQFKKASFGRLFCCPFFSLGARGYISDINQHTMSKFTPSELEVQADKIMDSFNFEKIQKHMEDTNHQWYQGGGRMGVPDLTDLRITARDLLTKAIYSKEECTNVGTGGFVAYKLPWGMQLTFQLGWASAV